MVHSGDGRTAQTGQQAVARSCVVEGASVGSFLGRCDRPRLSWVEGSTAIAAGGAAATVVANGSKRFDAVKREGTALLDRIETDETPHAARPRLFGGFSFTDDHVDPGEEGTWQGYPGALFLLPAIQLVTTPEGGWLTAVATGADAPERASERLDTWRDRLESDGHQDTPATNGASDPAGPPGVVDRSYAPPRPDWQREIEQATDRIASGALEKVVLAQALSVQTGAAIDPTDVLARLADSYPDCFRFLFEPETGGTFLGATPERLVSLEGQTLDTEALAGSIGRGETVAEDEWLASQLRDSEKNNHEHELVVDAVLDQLAELATDVTTGARVIRKLSTVQHLRTPIRATVDEDRHVLDLVEALHPTPAVGGLPPDRALETIRETEVFDRGWYAAPVGWFDADGDGSFAVAIRSALTRDRTATLFAGAGIVPDSDPDEEWDELQLKYRPILDELQ
jgi:menaquinone-specific isochorismate synthase